MILTGEELYGRMLQFHSEITSCNISACSNGRLRISVQRGHENGANRHERVRVQDDGENVGINMPDAGTSYDMTNLQYKQTLDA